MGEIQKALHYDIFSNHYNGIHVRAFRNKERLYIVHLLRVILEFRWATDNSFRRKVKLVIQTNKGDIVK